MALINCPVCGKEVSDKALFCPQCNCRIIDKKENQPIICEECGTELGAETETCPNCGCPRNYTSIYEDKTTKATNSLLKKKSFWIASISCLIIILGIILGIGNYRKVQKEKSLESYLSNMEAVVDTMLTGAAKAETVGNLTLNVWHNAIYDKYDAETSKYTSGTNDFNDALGNLFKDADFKKEINTIIANQEVVNLMMKELKNPPDEYIEAYKDLCIYYQAYLEFTDLAISATGSYNSFSSDFHDAGTKSLNGYRTMKLHF